MLKQLLCGTVLATALIFGGTAMATAETTETKENSNIGFMSLGHDRNYDMPDTHTQGATIEGEVLSINGRDLMVRADDGSVATINTMAMTLDPTGKLVTPSIERGDRVGIVASLDATGEFAEAKEIASVQKAYSSKVHLGQAPTEEGSEYLQAQEKLQRGEAQ